MATETTNYSLTKPDGNEFYDVQVFNENTDIIDAELKTEQNHREDTAAHISTYTHTKTGTVHNLAGTGNNITFLAKAAIADGDTWSVNGTAVTATLQNGDPLPADLFKAENWVTGVRLDGAKLGFKSAGRGKSDFNIFCQPTLPTDKFDGICLLTSTQITPKKVVFDKDTYVGEGYMSSGEIPDNSNGRILGGAGIYGNEAFFIGGLLQTNNNLTANGNAYNFTTHTYRSINGVLPTAKIYFGTVATSNEIFCFGGDNNTAQIQTSHAYNMITDTVRTLASYPQSASEYISCSFNSEDNSIYCFGGSQHTAGTQVATSYIYNITNNTYTSATIMDYSGSGRASIKYGNEIFLFGQQPSLPGMSNAYNIITKTYRTLASLPTGDYNYKPILVDNEIFLMCSANNNYTVYSVLTNTYRTLTSPPNSHANGYALKYNDIIALFGANYNIATHNKVDVMSLTPKQYQDEESVIIYWVQNDFTFIASLLKDKLCDYAPFYFKDVMLFQNGKLLFPALYLGNGTSWSLIRAAK